jgi:hypothetical protein
MSTEPVQIERATSGKALRINFGASIYRVVAIDLSDAAFEPGTSEIRAQWQPRLGLLVDRRMQAFRRQVAEAWDAKRDSYALTIEPEVFWRRGGPPKRLDVRVPGSR